MKKYILPVSVFIASLFMVGLTVHANPSFFQRQATAPGATSTIAFMTAGTGTTTLTFDLGVSQANAADSATLLIQDTASSTAPVLKFRQEFSNDNIDWYSDVTPNYLPSLAGGNSTTTAVITPFHEYSITFATSTNGDMGGSGTPGRSNVAIQISTPTRYTRIKLYVPVSGGNQSIWAEIAAKKQVY